LPARFRTEKARSVPRKRLQEGQQRRVVGLPEDLEGDAVCEEFERPVVVRLVRDVVLQCLAPLLQL